MANLEQSPLHAVLYLNTHDLNFMFETTIQQELCQCFVIDRHNKANLHLFAVIISTKWYLALQSAYLFCNMSVLICTRVSMLPVGRYRLTEYSFRLQLITDLTNRQSLECLLHRRL